MIENMLKGSFDLYIHAKIVNALGLGDTTLFGDISLNYPVCGYFNGEIVETDLTMGATGD